MIKPPVLFPTVRWARLGLLGLIAAGATTAGAFLWDLHRGTTAFLRNESQTWAWIVFFTDQADNAFLEEKIRSLPGLLDGRWVNKEESLARAQWGMASPRLPRGQVIAL